MHTRIIGLVSQLMSPSLQTNFTIMKSTLTVYIMNWSVHVSLFWQEFAWEYFINGILRESYTND